MPGIGVALGHSMLVAPHLERGTLVGLFEPPVAAPARYFLAVAPGSGDKPEARALPGLAPGRDAKERRGREACGGARPARQRLRLSAPGPERRPAAHGRLRQHGLSLALGGALDVSLRQGTAARCRSGARLRPIPPYT